MNKILEIKNPLLKLLFQEHDIVFNLEYDKYQNIMVDIFLNNNIKKTKKNHYVLDIIGVYYQFIKKNYQEAINYYLLSIKKGTNTNAMTNLGDYYYENENYEEMKKYYQMAIKLGNAFAMHNLAYFYEDIKNYDEMKKYYLMAIDRNKHPNTIYNLCNYFINEEYNYDEAIKYIILIYNINYKDDYNDTNTDAYKLFIQIENKINLNEFYNKLICIENKSDQVKILIEKLKNNFVNIYKIKLAFSQKHNIKDDCAICLEKDKLILTYNCMHWVCADCFPIFNTCTICKFI